MPWTEVLPIVGGVGLIDKGRPAGSEFRPGDIDAVLEGRAAAARRCAGRAPRAGVRIVVDPHELLVLERKEGRLWAGLENGPSGEVERGPVVLGRSEDEEAARSVPIGGSCRAALEQLT